MSANAAPVSPIERFTQLQSRVKQVYALADLSEQHRELTRQAARPETVANELTRARERGYRFTPSLETTARDLDAQWQETSAAVRTLIDEETAQLGEIRRKIENIIDGGYRHKDDPSGLESILPMLEGQIDALENAVKQAERRISPRFADFRSAADAAESVLRTIHAHLDLLADASFTLDPDEALYIAAPAEWAVTGKGDKDPDGVLFLTSARLLFEQKETTGRKLGMFGGQKVHELKWAVALGQVQAVSAENKGLFGGKDMITLTLDAGAPYPRITLEVKGGVKSQYWAEQIEGVARGTIAPLSKAQLAAAQAQAASASPADAAVTPIEVVVSVPTQCASCGSALGSAETGARAIICRFCGMANPIITRRTYPPITRANLARVREIGGFGEAGSEYAIGHMMSEMSFSHDGSRLLTRALSDVCVWDVEARAPLHRQSYTCTRLMISPDGAYMAGIGERQQTLDIFDAATGARLYSFTTEARIFASTLAFSPDGRWLAAATYNPTQVLLYALPDWSLAHTLPMKLFVSGLAFRADSAQLVISCSQEVNPTRSEYAYETRIISLPDVQVAQIGVGGEDVSLHPDGTHLIIHTQMYALPDGIAVGGQIGMFRVGYSADAGLLVSSMRDRLLWIDAESRAIALQIVGFEPYVSSWALAGNGGLLAVSSGGGMPGSAAQALPHRGVRLYAIV